MAPLVANCRGSAWAFQSLLILIILEGLSVSTYIPHATKAHKLSSKAVREAFAKVVSFVKSKKPAQEKSEPSSESEETDSSAEADFMMSAPPPAAPESNVSLAIATGCNYVAVVRRCLVHWFVTVR
jgi:hypothetical protein